MFKVFLSHSSEDKEFVSKFDQYLRAFGVDTFLDGRDIDIGADIVHEIYKGIEKSSFILYFISLASINSEWVQEELSIAKMKEKSKKSVKILPILIEDIKEIPTAIQSKRYADFRNRSIDINADNFQLVLKALGVISKNDLHENIKIARSNATRGTISSTLIASADLVTILSDLCFLLRFPTQTNDDSKSIRRLMETKNEIANKQLPEKFELLLESFNVLKNMTLIAPLIADLKKRVSKFFATMSEVYDYVPKDRPKTEWLMDAVEVSSVLSHN